MIIQFIAVFTQSCVFNGKFQPSLLKIFIPGIFCTDLTHSPVVFKVGGPNFNSGGIM